MSSLIGQRLGQYELTALLGKGGMATVYLAYQASVKREVAVKVIKSDLAEISVFVSRFEREAQMVAQLSHPHILRVFDFGQQDDIAYLVMELLRGGSLADLISKAQLTVSDAVRLIDQIASALDYAHERGIIHRDLKPQNVLLDEKGNAYLTDFGIAKILSETKALTQSGIAMGTPAYMSPEQWEGQSLDARTDVYALGIMLFEMLAAKTPFSADTPVSMMHHHIYATPPSLHERRPDLPPAVDAVIAMSLAKKREDRFASAGQLSEAFRAALLDNSTVSPPRKPIALPRTGKPSQTASQTVVGGSNASFPWKFRALGLVVILLVALGAGFSILRPLSNLSNALSGSSAESATTLVLVATSIQTATLTALATATALPPTTRSTETQTPSPTATATPTYAAATATALPPTARSTETRTPAPTPTASFTLTATIPLTLAPSGTDVPTITANKQWTPVVKQFDGIDMVLVPPGCFMMGITPAQADTLNKQYNVTWFTDEVPQQQICFDRAFWIDRTDVTQAQFQQLGGQVAYGPYFTGAKRPVDNITWFEARDFCVEKRAASLPTEAEWEYAARGPDDLAYPWGNTFVADDVVYSSNSNNQPASVGSKPGGKSWVGALDMSGNVFQWVSSLQKPYPYSATDGREDENATGERGLRGGSYSVALEVLRTTVRGRHTPTGEGDNVGFRCARSS